MNRKTIDRIAWWIPFRKLRDDIREYFHDVSNYKYAINDLRYIGDILNDFQSKNDVLTKYRKLINGLDNESIEIISNIVSALSTNNMYFTDSEAKIKADLLKKHSYKIISIGNGRHIYDNKYILNRYFFEFPNFYDKIGLDYVKNHDFIKDKAIIDAGGFIGDTALILSDYTNDKVYSFEPFLSNFNSMKENIELNNKTNIEPVLMALGDENKEIYINDEGIIGSGHRVDKKYNLGNKVEMTTLDSFVEKNNIKVGLIKTDLEGFEQPFLRGAINTIKKQKPVLIISIYHNYSDFFDIKPMIEELDLGYKFRIQKSNDFNIILETKLIAEVY